MAEKLTVPGYIHCEKHDIFFSEEQKKAADEKNQKRDPADWQARKILACPMCDQDIELFSLRLLAKAVG